MKFKYIILSIVTILLVGCQTKQLIPTLVPLNGTLVVFDGGAVKQGKGFALPRGLSKLELSYERPHSNKIHLNYNLKFKGGWTGCGWNWYAWNGEGNNIKDYKNFTFYIAVSPGKFSNMTFQLTSKNKNGGQDGMGPKVSILPAITKRSKYLKVTIPIKKLIGGSLDETSVWGFNLGVFAGKSSGKGENRIYIDQIEFTE